MLFYSRSGNRDDDMALEVKEQIKQLVAERNQILILFPATRGGDAIGAATGLATALERMGKRVDIVSPGFSLSAGYHFLERAKTIKNDLPHLRKFLLLVDVKDTGLSSLTYDVKDGELKIAITPEHGLLGRDRIRTAQTDFAYDLIITLGATDLKNFGTLYENNTELFFKTPIVNMDIHPSNERFGSVNVVEHNVASLAEAVFGLLKTIASDSIDSSVATALLAGIVAKTRSFKNDATTPDTLTNASALMTLGADREGIVRQLFRTRNVATLKLWGQVLQHLQTDKTIGLVASSVTREDFSRTGASEDDIADIIDELIANSPDARVTLLLHEHTEGNGIHALIRTEAGIDAKELARPFHPTGDERTVSCALPHKSIHEAEENMLEHIRASLRQKN